MQPRYVTVSSSGSSPWQPTNWDGRSPMHIGFGILTSALSSRYEIDVTMDDPTATFPSSAGPTVFSASAIGGPIISSANQIGNVTTPIAAWRLTNTSTGGIVTVSWLELGIG